MFCLYQFLMLSRFLTNDHIVKLECLSYLAQRMHGPLLGALLLSLVPLFLSEGLSDIH